MQYRVTKLGIWFEVDKEIIIIVRRKYGCFGKANSEN